MTRVKLLRLLMGHNVAELADYLNITSSYYVQIENQYVNLSRKRSKDLAEKLEEFYGCPISFLLSSVTKEERETIINYLKREAHNGSLESEVEAFFGTTGENRETNEKGEARLGNSVHN